MACRVSFRRSSVLFPQAVYANYVLLCILQTLFLRRCKQAFLTQKVRLLFLDQASCVSNQEIALVHTYFLVEFWLPALNGFSLQDLQTPLCFGLLLQHPFLF